MNLNEALKQNVLQPDAGYLDWRDATPQAREFYVLNACQKCEEAKLGKAKPANVIAAIDHVYADKQCRHLPLSRAFGQAFAIWTNKK